MNGVININKPEGWTSQDVCAKLRSRLHIRKIGHTGTLDPMATGVLPVCIGKATRIIEYYDADCKSYHATMKLGITTDTLDITGEVLNTASYSNVSENDVREAFRTYTGRVSQLPPKYSALKVDGKRAYELAREGVEFELKAREIEIFSNDIRRLDLGAGEIEFDVNCSKGTYIRTICDDIGRSLGCGAAMSSLCRTASGFFKIEDSTDIETLCAMAEDEIASRIIPADNTLINLGVVTLDDNRVNAFINGNTSSARCYEIHDRPNYKDYYKVYGGRSTKGDSSAEHARFLGIATIVNSELKPVKVMAEILR